jgi:rhomboid protease GluP
MNQTPPSPSQPAPENGGPVEIGRVAPQRVQVRLPQARPVATYTLLVVTCMVFLLQMLSQYLLGNDYLIALGAKSNALILKGQVWRFLTPALLHVNIVHIGFNMYALYIIGRDIERYYGHARFLMLYLVGAFAGNVASFWMSDKASVGASTALFGLIAAQGMFIYQNRKIFGRQSMRLLANVGVVVVINLALGLSPGIDNWGHVGGLLGGALFAWLAGPKLALHGLFPDFSLQDQREPATIWSVAALELAAITGLAVLGMLR